METERQTCACCGESAESALECGHRYCERCAENLLALAREFGVSVAELTGTPETPQPSEQPASPLGFTPAKRRRLVVRLVLVRRLPALWKLLWAVGEKDSSTPDASTTAEAAPNSAEQTVPVPAPKTDFALIWYGMDGQEEFLELGEQERFFPYGTTLELTEPLESHDSDCYVMTSQLADCGGITVGYYHIEEDPASNPETSASFKVRHTQNKLLISVA